MRCVYVSALVRGCVRACVCDDAPLRGGGVEGHPPWELSRARPRCTLPCGGILQTLLKYGNFLCPAPCSPKPVPGEPEGGSGRAQPRAAAVVPVAPGPESGVGAPGRCTPFSGAGSCARARTPRRLRGSRGTSAPAETWRGRPDGLQPKPLARGHRQLALWLPGPRIPVRAPAAAHPPPRCRWRHLCTPVAGGRGRAE